MEWIILGWIACGIGSYGIMVNHFQAKFPSIAAEAWLIDRIFAAFVAMTGPVGLIASITFSWLVFRDGEKNTFGWRL